MVKFPQYVGLKLPLDVVEAAKQQAEADDRTFSAYLRRIIIAAVQQKVPAREDEADRG
jgi:hypothetical protein